MYTYLIFLNINMLIYFSLIEYASEKNITELGAQKRYKNGRIIKLVSKEGKKIGYIDTIDTLNVVNSNLQKALS